MVLEPTSPTRQPFHIVEAVERLAFSGADSLASVSEVPHHYVPSKLLAVDKAGQLLGITGVHIRDMAHRRQDLPVCYAFNGLIFACRSALIMGDPPTIWGDKVAGQQIGAKYCVDLDQPEDWNAAEYRMRQLLDERDE
jgi:CMP-N-acetylneuraminic acid synthetase